MRKGKRIVIIFLVLIFCIGHNVMQISASEEAVLSAQDFVDQMSVGWNLGNTFDCSVYDKSRGYDLHLNQEKLWGNPAVTRELIDYVASTGINTIRIPVTWYYNTGVDENGYVYVGHQWLSRVGEVVQYALDRNMYVIIDSHHDEELFHVGVSDEELLEILQNVNMVWGQIATYFKDYDEKLMFEGFNEVDNMEATWRYTSNGVRQMNMLNQTFVDSVRATGGKNSHRNLIVPTLFTRAYDSNILSEFRLPDDQVAGHLIIAVHYYSSKFDQNIEPVFQMLENFSQEKQAPVIITEMGNSTKSEIPQMRIFQAMNFTARAAEHGLRCIWWDNGKEFMIVNRKDFSQSNVEMIQALLLGRNGLAWDNKNLHCYIDVNDFVYMIPNMNTGNLEYKHWGTLTTENLIPVKGDTQYLITLLGSGSASKIWLARVAYYDENGQFIRARDGIKKIEYIAKTPENAAYMRIAFHNPYTKVSMEEYVDNFVNHQILLTIEECSAEGLEEKLLSCK